jgi:hypothetical protein
VIVSPMEVLHEAQARNVFDVSCMAFTQLFAHHGVGVTCSPPIQH